MITPLSEYPLAAEVFDIWASVRKRILVLTLDIGGNKSKAWWSQQLPLTREWDPCYLSDLHSFIFGDLEPHGKLPHSWVTNTVSPLTCSIWYNLFAAQTFGLFYVSPSPLLINSLPPIKSVFVGWKAVKWKQLLQSTFSSPFISFAKLWSLASCISGQNSKYSIVHYTEENTVFLEHGIHLFLGIESQNGLDW